jgi:glucosamine-6-phosphate deaminase
MKVFVLESRAELGGVAARDIGDALRSGLHEKPHLRMILAAAPSQSEMLAALVREPGIEWQRVTAFHMDEYLDLPEDAPQRFGRWLERAFFDRVPLGKANLICPGIDPEAACRAYASLLAEAPIDVVLLGIGTNGHLAFNDPPADLNDPLAVKIVELDQMCREQQVLDGCFAALDDVPRRAITLTVPTLLGGCELFCCVPGRHKSAAVGAMMMSPISAACPATALRTHPKCNIYLDRESSSLIKTS